MRRKFLGAVAALLLSPAIASAAVKAEVDLGGVSVKTPIGKFVGHWWLKFDGAEVKFTGYHYVRVAGKKIHNFEDDYVSFGLGKRFKKELDVGFGKIAFEASADFADNRLRGDASASIKIAGEKITLFDAKFK